MPDDVGVEMLCKCEPEASATVGANGMQLDWLFLRVSEVRDEPFKSRMYQVKNGLIYRDRVRTFRCPSTLYFFISTLFGLPTVRKCSASRVRTDGK